MTTAVAGFGVFGGTAAAWVRHDIDFKGCTEVWQIVDKKDLDEDKHDPPLVGHVIVESSGKAECREVEFTKENATKVPGQYGDDPVVKFEADDGEKILGVIMYNEKYDDSSNKFERPRCVMKNEHRCAQTPNTPDIKDADCVGDAVDNGNGGLSDCWFEPVGQTPPDRDTTGRGKDNKPGNGTPDRGPSDRSGGPPR